MRSSFIKKPNFVWLAWTLLQWWLIEKPNLSMVDAVLYLARISFLGHQNQSRSRTFADHMHTGMTSSSLTVVSQIDK
jgi:hypothetical protein